MMDDFMEMGESGLIPLPDGWWLHKPSGHRISPGGDIFDRDGVCIGQASVTITDADVEDHD